MTKEHKVYNMTSFPSLSISTIFTICTYGGLVSSFTIKMTPPSSRTWVAAHPQDLARPNLFPNLFGSRSTIATTGNEGHNGPLHATIIGWDDESDSYISTFDEPSYYDTMIFKEQIPTSTSTVVADTLLLHNMDKVARLAVAFSPPTHPIKLEDINQIHIINVTNRHIEISVVVCDESQCVTLLVPISFRHDCSTNCSHNSSADQCILDSIFELDVEAQELIKLRDVEYNSDLRP